MPQPSNQDGSPELKSDFILPCRSRLAAACAIGLAVWALRVALIGDLGTGIPWMDQWECEGLTIYQPWIEGRLSWQTIFAPYLEHRIAWTHLWNLGLFEWCGQWDPMMQMVAQAGIVALTAGWCVWGLVAVHSGWFWRIAVLAGALMAFGAPFAYQNILWGFQSCFAMFVALSLGACAFTALAWRQGRYGWLALFAGLAVPLAMGAGIVVGPVIIGLTVLAMVAERRITRRVCAMLVVGTVCFLWGLWLRSDSAPGVEYAYAKSVAQFLHVWLAACAWPNSGTPWLAGLACLPVGLLIAQILRKGVSPPAHKLFIIGVSLWAMASAAGGAWARGALGTTPPSRYSDFLAMLCWANLLALFEVIRTWRKTEVRSLRIFGAVITIAWVGSAVYGGIGLWERFSNTDRPAWQQSAAQQLEEANSFLVRLSDAMSAREKQGRQSLAYEKVMESRTLASFLPPEVRMPFKGITQENTLALAQADATVKWQWESGHFDAPMSAMIMFVRGDATKLNLKIVSQDGETKAEFQPSGRHIGAWSEWLACPKPGNYRLSVQTASAAGDLAVILPRPLSAAGYWARWVGAKRARLVELAGISLAVALLSCRPKACATKNVAQTGSA